MKSIFGDTLLSVNAVSEEELKRVFLARTFLLLAGLGCLILLSRVLFDVNVRASSMTLGFAMVSLIAVAGMILTRVISPSTLTLSASITISIGVAFGAWSRGDIAAMAYLVAPVLLMASVFSARAALAFALGGEALHIAIALQPRFSDQVSASVTIGGVLILSFTISALMSRLWAAAFEVQRRTEAATVDYARSALAAAFPATALLVDDTIQEPTTAFRALFGETIDGAPLSSICCPEDFGALQDAIATNIPIEIRQGEQVLELFSAPLQMPQIEKAGLHVLAARDVTDRARLAEQAATSQRVVALGELAAGVAHEIQNPLTSLVLCVGFLEEGEPADPEDISEIQRSAERIRQTVKDLTALTNTKGEPPTSTSVHEPIVSAMRIAEATIRAANATINVELDDGELCVLAPPVRLGQALAHILVNAVTAQGEPPVRQPEVKIRTRRSGDKVELRVIDNGLGIDPEILPRIFDPFVTSREVGEGAGLGLSLAHSVLTSAEGNLEVEKTGPEGTTFLLRLQMAEPGDDDESRPSERPLNVSHASALVTAADSRVGEAIAKMLRRYVASVESLPISDARENLAKKEYDLVICEVGVGRDSGVELLQRLPATTCGVALRGGRMTQAAKAFLDGQWGGYILQKPVTERRLLGALRALEATRAEITKES